MNMSEARAAFAQRALRGTQAHTMAALDNERYPAYAFPASRIFELLCERDHAEAERARAQSTHEHATQHLGPDA